MLASKHLDIVTGVDIHIIQPPGPSPPIPVPHPFIGFLFDSADYNIMAKAVGAMADMGVDFTPLTKVAATIGSAMPDIPDLGVKEMIDKAKAAADSVGLHSEAPSTVWVNHLPRARAGTIGSNKPLHIPIGGMFSKGSVGNACEAYMGSSTVLVDKEPFTYMSLPALSCQCIGIPAPPRGGKTKQMGFFLPTSVVLSIPLGPMVKVGGDPITSRSSLAKKLFAAGLAKLRSSKLMRNLSQRMHNAAGRLMDRLGLKPGSFARNLVHRGICSVTGHPVDIATGKVFTDTVDFELPGPVPLVWERVWYSTSVYQGPLGHGWHHSYDMAMAVDEFDQTIVIRMADGRPVIFPLLEVGGSYINRQEQLTLERDDEGYLLRDKAQLFYRFTKDAYGAHQTYLLGSIANANGFAIRFAYNHHGHLEQIKDSAGRLLPVKTDSAGRILAIHAPHPLYSDQSFSIAQYRYDEDGDLIATLDAHDQPFRYAYENHLLVQETNRNSLSFYFTWEGTGGNARCIRTWGDGGIYDHKLYYDPDAQKTVVEDSLGNRTTHFYNDMGLVYKVIDAKGNTSTTTYNSDCQIIAETNALGLATRYGYDERGNKSLIIRPDGATTKMIFNGQNLLVNAVDPVGGKWIWIYDERQNLLSRKDSLGRTSNYKYEDGLLTSIIDAAGRQIRMAYDEQFNTIRLTTPDNYSSQWVYDHLGRITDRIDPNGNRQRVKFNLLGQAVKVEEPDGNKRSLKYDPEGNIIHARDRQHDIAFEYGGFNTLHARIENGTHVSFHYDTEEQLTSIRNEHGDVYRFQLDPNSDVIRETGFDGLTRVYERDPLGRVARIQRPSGLETIYDYDLADRVIRIEHSDGSKESFSYRPDGELMQADNGAISVRFERDLPGRVIREDQGGYKVSSEYDALDFRTALRSSLGAEVHFDRDIMGDVKRIAAQGLQNWEAHFKHDTLGLELERQLPGQVTSRWSRDRIGRPVQQTISTAGKPVRSRHYHWDVNDRLKKLTLNGTAQIQFEHDAVGNLAAARYEDGSTEYRMPDAVGNLFRTKNRTDRRYGPAGQLLEAEGIRYEYDAEGNLIRKRMPDGTSWNFKWNTAGMLARVIRPDSKTVNFLYDALGRRIAKTFMGLTTRWVWDGNTPLHEWTEPAEDLILPINADRPNAFPPAVSRTIKEDSRLTTWLFEPDSFAPLAKLSGNRQYSIISDHLGTPTNMLDESGGLVWSANTDIYGDLRNLVGERQDCPFRFPGQYEDLETGLYYNRFRYYDREGGEYLSQDKVRLAGGRKLYSYVHDPLIFIDKFGLSSSAYGLTVRSGRGRAHQRGEPNSIYEQVGTDNKVRSRTFYDENGNSFARQDFDHPHGGMMPHEHSRTFDVQGRPITQKDTNPLPGGYDDNPTVF